MPKILIVDDDEVIRTMYAEVFSKNGFEVTEAVDGVDGLDKATKNIPNIIFTGIVMPRMDGFGLMEALKKNISTSSIPVVISSHMGREEDQKKAQGLGAKDFIALDFNTPNEVVAKIKTILESREYLLKFSINEMDAPKLAKDLLASDVAKCQSCNGELALSLKPSDIKKHIFFAKFICINCRKTQE